MQPDFTNIPWTPQLSTPQTRLARVGRMKVFFRKDRLPPARVFYERELGSLSRPNRKGWALGRCPFHKSTSGRSFSVNVDSGEFRCFGCDAHGGDVLSFLRQRDGLSFKDAAQRLGAWDGNDGKPFKIQPGPLERWLVMDFEIDGVKYQAAVKDEPKTNYSHTAGFMRRHRPACSRSATVKQRNSRVKRKSSGESWLTPGS